MSEDKRFVQAFDRVCWCVGVLVICLVTFFGIAIGTYLGAFDLQGITKSTAEGPSKKELWQARGTKDIPDTKEGDLIRYGLELIAHTSVYLGPKGKVASVSNGMNCQNCHLLGGTKAFGNNYALVASRYPKFRNRSGTVEGFEKRVNDCFQRSLNGEGLDPGSREMKAMVAYLKWVGEEVAKDESPYGTGLIDVPLLDRPADSLKGAQAYQKHCSRCHGENGEGQLRFNANEWAYPPLWGPDSYNTGAGLFRLSRFAAFIKANMPYGITFETPALTDEEAWDISAFVNSMPRPRKNFQEDWPDISKKPVDHPFGPYTDGFSEKEHKYGPFTPILASKKK